MAAPVGASASHLPMVNNSGEVRVAGGTSTGAVPLPCLHNCTGGEWSRLRSFGQGKRAEEGNDELVNHALQTTQAPTLVSASSTSLPDQLGRLCQPGFVTGPDPGIS